MKTEFILYATRKGDEDWQEELITTAEMIPGGMEKINKAIEWAKSQGFDRWRVTTFSQGDLPDFGNVVRVGIDRVKP